MQFSLTDNEKIEAIDFSIKEFEKSLILRLSAINIDFEDFDPSSFENEADPSKGSHAGIIDILNKIKALQIKKEALETK
jgi:hypothetical protein